MIREITLNTALFNHAFVGQGGADATAVGREAAPEQQDRSKAIAHQRQRGEGSDPARASSP
jgi:hypothetical protein